MIEGRRRPGSRGMALRAVRGEVSRDVVGVRRALEIFQVTANARCAREVVIVVRVAVDALPWRHGVPAGQRKSNRRVIERRIQPGVRSVTGFTSGGKLRADVVGIAGFLKIRGVTGIAFRGHRLKLAAGCAFVTGVAIDCRVRARQREAVVVLLDLLDRNLPPADRVALLAIRSQLPSVNVRVTILASLSDFGEYRLDVTLRAGHRLVHAAQRVSRLIVIEFGNRADGSPSICRVAVLARHVQIAVRTVCNSRGLRRRASRGSGKHQ